MELYREAIERFQRLFERAQNTALAEPAAMTLATADRHGRPSARTVLLKQVSEAGLVFYTNTHSRKGRQLSENPRAALCLFWQPLLEQVLIEGSVQLVAAQEADGYWATRERASQLGAWASQQSELLESRAWLENRVRELEARYADQPVPRPPYWTGYRLVPDLIEFWHSRPGRLHERYRYWFEAGAWRCGQIQP
ncbi:pyridoxamine 5'-phosphate oxidase [Nitrococcus mobilis]|uniref:Pyridoxine/pyridoxamine 5'-phosphate oxidase n=1 Tax=Nitrococcus mobilis Nb-231 TaxID=314278 RepID=A4BSW0_9GAMM|nr:pyridoxamine 5'-phosphate oxidase [Nitrococcus mobilis]EAR21204.1 pyridoxamine 5'-phosphate oxidase [Nitrococcus mobilis Nb-231]